MNEKIPNKNEIVKIKVKVTNIGINGDGIANEMGERYFIPYSAPGDYVSISIGNARKGGRIAKINNIINRSEIRTDPACLHFGTCGGCTLQHLQTKEIANLKRGFVASALEKQGLSPSTLLPTVEIPPGLRRRVRFAVNKSKRVTFGFFEPHSNQIVDINRCPAIQPAIADLIYPLRNLIIATQAITRVATVQVTLSDTGLDILIRPGKVTDLKLEDRETFANFANQYDLARISWHGSLGAEPIAQRREPRHQFGPAAVTLPPTAFLQPSKKGENVIATAACVALQRATRIADLYAGCGALTFPFSRIAPTHAFEGDDEMVSAIKRAARKHPVTAHLRDLARRPLTAPELNDFDAVVFDPPRSGAKSQAAALAGSSVPVVIAVSCNPGTLARDLSLLIDGGYTLQSVLPIDQFPWSSHVEAVAILGR